MVTMFKTHKLFIALVVLPFVVVLLFLFEEHAFGAPKETKYIPQIGGLDS